MPDGGRLGSNIGVWVELFRGTGWPNFRRGLKALSSETAMSSWKLHRAASNSNEKVV